MTLPTPSLEQQAIIDACLSGHNIKVSAVAGSGKTTTMLMICKALSDSKNVLALTYNARLKDEMRVKIETLRLTNAEAHSYHAFFVRYYGAKCCTDSGILDMLNRNDPPCTNFRFGCVILDEVQDMTPLYFRAVKKLILDMSNMVWSLKEPTENTFDDLDEAQPLAITINNDDDDFDFTSTAGNVVVASQPIQSSKTESQKTEPIYVQLCLFGDPSQNIYAFKEADDRFLTLSHIIWNGFSRIRTEWSSLDLSQSFRVTKPIAEFVNRGMLGYEKIRSVKAGSRVKYMICNVFGSKPTTVVKALLQRYKPQDFFIIAPSVRAIKSPIKKLENNLVAAGYPCFVPTADDEILKQDVISGKIVFSSIHQTKGLERKVVMLFGFDASYFKFFNKDDEPSICPNALYVGVTRAMEELILVHEHDKEFLPFLNQTYIYSHCETIIDRFNPKPIDTPDRSKISVIDLTRHLTVEYLSQILTRIVIREVYDVSISAFTLASPINIPVIVDGTSGKESVAELNGTCIPTIYEYDTQTHVSIIDYIESQKNRLATADRMQVDKCLLKVLRGNKPSNKEFLYLANVYNSLRTGYLFKLRQISNYDWLEPNEVAQALCVMQKYIPSSAKFERLLTGTVKVHGIDRNISGCIDAITVHNGIMYVWEFKCVKELQPEHSIQLLVYMWLFLQSGITTPVRFCLLNILTDTVLEIVPPENLNSIVKELISEKIKIRHRTIDDEFLQSITSSI
jgi:hypothetical protein